MKDVRLFTLTEFQKWLLTSSLTLEPIDTGVSGVIGDNYYSYNSTYRALRVNTVGAGSKHIYLQFIGGKIGDTIEIEVEVYNVSGTKPSIFIDTEFSIRAQKTNEWELLGGKFVLTRDYDVNLIIGNLAGETGDNYYRNVKVKLSSPFDYSKYVRSNRLYAMYFGASDLVLSSSYSPDSCTWVISSTDITITHGTAFANYKNGVVTGEFFGNTAGKYQIKPYTISPTSFKFKIYDTSANAYIDPTTLIGVTTWFNLVHNAWDSI